MTFLSILIWSIVIAACLTIVWLAAGRRIALILDQLITLRLKSLPASHLQYDIANLRIGDVSMPLVGTDNERFNLGVQTDSQNRLVLSQGGKSFVLGPRTTPPDPSGRPEIEFIPEPGDKLSFRVYRSVLSQPTLFHINIMGGRTPSWRRCVYYRLVWKKLSGARLKMLWRLEQQCFGGTGWTEGLMMYDFRTGLIRVEIRVEAIAMETVVAQYISRTKGWKRTDYRIESRGLSTDGRSDVLAVIHLQDERSPSPGAGQSVVLYVDRDSHQVKQEFGGQ
jgi:hypothetical protein